MASIQECSRGAISFLFTPTRNRVDVFKASLHRLFLPSAELFNLRTTFHKCQTQTFLPIQVDSNQSMA